HMQQIAREINAPVTGFVLEENNNHVSVRFFMPSTEIAMCGHVTVGLFTHLHEEALKAGHSMHSYVMQAPIGDVNIRIDEQEDCLPIVMMQLTVPSIKTSEVDLDALSSALGIPSSSIATHVPVGIADAGLNHLMVHLASLSEVQNLAPDFQKLTEISRHCGVQTVACFSMQTEAPENTLHVRDFCPAVGVDEVPASGTTNGALAGYLVQHSLVPAEDQRIWAEQGSEIGRPSSVCSEIQAHDKQMTGLMVGGQAVASIKGILSNGV
ncbi:MAG: PhzF family phenazine biosynthesis protein, partial [Methylococcales bacterium]|nr:PhzF family phenazine biosynthesis protein [Methylococcales bacterium]